MNRLITTIKNDLVVEARALQSAKGRSAAGQFLLEGEEQIRWALSSPCSLLRIFVHDKLMEHAFLLELKQKGIPFFFTSDGILKKISDTSYLVPFIGVAQSPQPLSLLTNDFIVVLDGVQDFGNIGTIIRTASAFGVQEFATTNENFDLYYKRLIDASRGTVFSSCLQRFSSAKEATLHLKKQGYQIAVTTPHASTMQGFVQVEPKPIALVLGNETHGASQEMMEAADIRIQIPMSGLVESLNVGVAAGISLYEMKIKWVLAMLTKKIQESVGRDLFCASKWLRMVFDQKLREVCPINADQAIMLMILKCEGNTALDQLAHDAGLSPNQSASELIAPLIQAGYLYQTEKGLNLTLQGEEAIAKIWSVHELSEQLAFEGVPEQDKQAFLAVLQKMMSNCRRIIPYA